jgi:hypothetical protein
MTTLFISLSAKSKISKENKIAVIASEERSDEQSNV